MNINSESRPVASGEIDPSKKDGELEHLNKREKGPDDPEAVRDARITKYQELIGKKTEELTELSDDYIKERGRAAYDKALENGNDGDMASRLRDATEKNLKERAESLSELIADMQQNVRKLESGQDDLYSSN